MANASSSSSTFVNNYNNNNNNNAAASADEDPDEADRRFCLRYKFNLTDFEKSQEIMKELLNGMLCSVCATSSVVIIIIVVNIYFLLLLLIRCKLLRACVV